MVSKATGSWLPKLHIKWHVPHLGDSTYICSAGSTRAVWRSHGSAAREAHQKVETDMAAVVAGVTDGLERSDGLELQARRRHRPAETTASLAPRKEYAQMAP